MRIDIIVLFAAFEREFKNYYSDFKRSELFFNKKNEVITILNNNITECKNRKERKYVERFITCIENSDYSLGACLKHALNDCEDIIKVFVQSIYNKYDNDLINDISERMNLLRNNIAHGKLDFEIEPLNISDIQILEVLLYAIRLNKLNMDCKLKKKSIVDLLGYNIAV